MLDDARPRPRPSSLRRHGLLEPLCHVAELLGAQRVAHPGVCLEAQAGALEGLARDEREGEVGERLEERDGFLAVCGVNVG